MAKAKVSARQSPTQEKSNQQRTARSRNNVLTIRMLTSLVEATDNGGDESALLAADLRALVKAWRVSPEMDKQLDEEVRSFGVKPKEPEAFTFTAKEFEQLGLIGLSVFDLSKSLGNHISGNGEGLNYCLKVVADELDNLICDVQERELKGGAA